MQGPAPVVDAIRVCHELLADVVTPGWKSLLLPPLACLEAMQGRFDVAREQLEEARVGRGEWGEPGTLATNWAYQAAWVERLAGDLATAEAILTDACDVLRQSESHAWLATNLECVG